jgi:hypothetical protein
MHSLTDHLSGAALKFNWASDNPFTLVNTSDLVSFIRVMADFLSFLDREKSLIVPARPVMTRSVSRERPIVLFSMANNLIIKHDPEVIQRGGNTVRTLSLNFSEADPAGEEKLHNDFKLPKNISAIRNK